MTNLSAIKINSNLIRINEKDERHLNVDSWLISGNEKALVVDTLQENELLYDMVTSLTSLPLEVVLTHGHIDHAGKALHKFLENNIPVYMNLADVSLLGDRFTKEEIAKIKDLRENEKFDLGGRVLEVVGCAGHTAGSMCLLDWDNKEVFSGDAIGSGSFWMQLPESLSLTSFIPNLLSFKQALIGMDDFTVYPGHIDGTKGKVDMNYIDDLLELCNGVISGKIESREAEMDLGNAHLKFKVASYGSIQEMLYKFI